MPPPVRRRSGATRDWIETYEALAAYQKLHGDCFVKDRHPLARWMSEQRSRRLAGSLKPEEERLLKDIDFPWDVNESKFDAACRAVGAFWIRHGHLDVPKDVRLGAPHSLHRPFLAPWITSQRSAFRRKVLAKERVAKLQSITGWTWERLAASTATNNRVASPTRAAKRAAAASLSSEGSGSRNGSGNCNKNSNILKGRAAAVLQSVDGRPGSVRNRFRLSSTSSSTNSNAPPPVGVTPLAAAMRSKPIKRRPPKPPTPIATTTTNNNNNVKEEEGTRQRPLLDLTGDDDDDNDTDEESSNNSSGDQESPRTARDGPIPRKRSAQPDAVVKPANKRVKPEPVLSNNNHSTSASSDNDNNRAIDTHIEDVMVFLMEKGDRRTDQERRLMKTLHNHVTGLTRKMIGKCLESSQRPEDTIEKIKDIAS